MGNYPYREITRRSSRKITVGKVAVGGDAPISVQSMTNTLTTDIDATVAQIERCVEAGADIMRVSVPDIASSQALKHIIQQIDIPVVADIHFHYQRGIEAAEAGAACLRINPGNIGSDDRVAEVVAAAKANGCSMRIGVNAGSLDKKLLDKYKEPCPEAMVESAMEHANILYKHDYDNFKISVKASDVFLAYHSYKQLAEAGDFPLHIGVTEAGGMLGGTVKSAMGLGRLLWEGIGDTIRVSLSADPEEEVRVAYEMLKALGLRHRGVNIISCPSCARQQFPVIDTVAEVEKRIQHIKTPMSVSIIGCVVNGPGEATHTNIGLTGGGNGTHLIYVDGKPAQKISSEQLVDNLVDIIEDKARVISSS